MRGSAQFCISGLTQETHHLSIVVTPTTSLLLVVFLCYVVSCVVLALTVYVSYVQLPLGSSRTRLDGLA